MTPRFPTRNLLWFGLVSALFLLHQWTQFMGWHVRLVDDYLDPFLAVPVMLGFTVFFLRIMRRNYSLNVLTISVYTLGLIVFFESGWIDSPKLHPDLWDVPGYVMGALFFDWKINPSSQAGG